MSTNRTELKVGLFMVVCIAMAAVLSIRFSEAGLNTGHSYTLKMNVPSAGTLVVDANVLMSGVRVGNVQKIELKEDGRGVLVTLRIMGQRRIYAEDKFSIQTVGFLGDQYVSIAPAPVRGAVLAEGAVVAGEEPFNLDQSARSVQGILKNAEGIMGEVAGVLLEMRSVAGSVSNIVARVDRDLLNTNSIYNITQTLANMEALTKDAKGFSEELRDLALGLDHMAQLGVLVINRIDNVTITNSVVVGKAMANFQNFTERLNATAGQIEATIATNQPVMAATLTNLAQLSRQMNTTAGQLGAMVATNGPAITKTISNVAELTGKLNATADELQAAIKGNRQDVTGIIKNMGEISANLKSTTGILDKAMKSVDAGEGVLGALLKDPKMRQDFGQMITNASTAVIRFDTLITHLLDKGLMSKGTNAAPTRPPPRSVRPETP